MHKWSKLNYLISKEFQTSPQGDQIFNFVMKLDIAELKVITLIQGKFVENKKWDQSGKNWVNYSLFHFKILLVIDLQTLFANSLLNYTKKNKQKTVLFQSILKYIVTNIKIQI